MTRNLKVGLVELYATADGTLGGRKSLDIYSVVRLPSRGIDLLAAVLRRAGWRDVLALNPHYTNRKRRFTEREFAALAACDVVGLSVITRNCPQSYELADRLREANPRVKILFGGPHPTALPDEALEHGDIVCMHEADHTIVEVLERLEDDRDRPALADLPGIAFRDPAGENVVTAARPFLTGEELSALPMIDYTPATTRRITHTVINTARGCPYECEYCSVIENFGRGFRFLDDDAVMANIRHTVGQARRPIFFGDDIFTAHPSRTKRLMERFLAADFKMPAWSAQVRVESGRDPELLALMRRAGCNRVYIGLESINDATLKLWNKHSTVEKNTRAIEAFHSAGISVHGMLVLGSEVDDVETVGATVAYAKRLKIDTAQFFSITPLPGPPLTARYEREGRILTKQWHLYDAQHVVVDPGRMSAHELQTALWRAQRDFYNPREALRHLISSNERLYNSAVRLVGNRLARRAERDSAEHTRMLRRLDALERDLAGMVARWRAAADGVLADLSLGIEERVGRARGSVEQVLGEIRERAGEIAPELKSYCQGVIHRCAESVQSSFNEMLGALEAASRPRLPSTT